METELKPFDFGKMVSEVLAIRRARVLSNVELPQDGQKLPHVHLPHTDSQSPRQLEHSSLCKNSAADLQSYIGDSEAVFHG